MLCARCMSQASSLASFAADSRQTRLVSNANQASVSSASANIMAIASQSAGYFKAIIPAEDGTTRTDTCSCTYTIERQAALRWRQLYSEQEEDKQQQRQSQRHEYEQSQSINKETETTWFCDEQLQQQSGLTYAARLGTVTVSGSPYPPLPKGGGAGSIQHEEENEQKQVVTGPHCIYVWLRFYCIFH